MNGYYIIYKQNIYLKKKFLKRASDYLIYNINYGRNKWN